MPPAEPNKKIEDVLTAYSQKRREQLEPGVELHPVSRKALLQEVTQTFGQAEINAPSRRGSVPWWRWAAVGAVLAWVVFLCIYIEVPVSKPLDPSLTNQFAAVKRPVMIAAAQPETTTQSPVAKAATPAPASPAPGKIADTIPMRSVRLASNPPVVAQNTVDEVKKEPANVPVATSAPAPVAQPVMKTAAPLGSTVTVTDRRQFVRLNYRPEFRENLHSPPLPKVLTAFDLERTGDAVRVLDVDGSVYDGTVSGADAEAYSFQVKGRSQRMDRPVVFTGSVSGKDSACKGEVRIGSDIEFQLQAVPRQ